MWLSLRMPLRLGLREALKGVISMKLQQLRYFISVAENGSIGEASRSLYISQSSLSAAIKELERELHIEMFNRSNRGLSLTPEGAEALAYARQVVAQADTMERRFLLDRHNARQEQRLAVSSQHYPFCSQVLLECMGALGNDAYTIRLHESSTSEVIEDVRRLRSDIGILYFDCFNESAIKRTIAESGLSFSLLASSAVYACLSACHPLSNQKEVTLKDLEPYPRFLFEQGADSSFFFYEEPFSDVLSKQNVIVSDRSTLLHCLRNSQGYNLCSKASKNEGAEGLSFVPVQTSDIMTLGFVVRVDRQLSPLANDFLARLNSLFCRREAADYYAASAQGSAAKAKEGKE